MSEGHNVSARASEPASRHLDVAVEAGARALTTAQENSMGLDNDGSSRAVLQAALDAGTIVLQRPAHLEAVRQPSTRFRTALETEIARALRARIAVLEQEVTRAREVADRALYHIGACVVGWPDTPPAWVLNLWELVNPLQELLGIPPSPKPWEVGPVSDKPNEGRKR